MRTYLILKEKVAAFNADTEIQGLLADLGKRGAASGARVAYTPDGARELKQRTFDLEGFASAGIGPAALEPCWSSHCSDAPSSPR